MASDTLADVTAKIVSAFQLFDVDGNGTISKQELHEILMRPSSGRAFTSEEIDQLFSSIDTDGNGSVDYTEFAAAWASKLAPLEGSSAVALEGSSVVAAAPAPAVALPKLTFQDAAASLGYDAKAAALLEAALSGGHGGAPPHFGSAALLASVESGAIAPLSGRWVLALHARGGRLERRQALPPEAFVPAATLRRWVEKAGEYSFGMLFVALSYRWLGKDAPDGDGFHLGIVAAVARLYLEFLKKYVFGPKGLGEADFALFWDYASLFQKPRTEAMDQLFGKGLKSSNIWYGHERTTCWMQPSLPPGFSFAPHLAQTYDDSGWCFVEAAISAGVKAGTLRLDLAKQTEAAMRGGYGDLRKVCMAARLPPLTPEEVRRRLQHEKTFTQGAADVEVVDNLYRAFFEGVAGHAKGLDFPRLEWGEAEARQLAAVLPRFAALKTLNLNGNRLGAGGVAALAPALKEMPRLATLFLSNNGVGDEGAKALAAVLPQTKITTLYLRDNNLTEEGNQAIKAAAGAGVTVKC